MFQKVGEDALHEAQKRLYAHYDYFGYIIPASWLLLGVIVVETYFFRAEAIRRLFDGLQVYAPYVGATSTAGQIILGVAAVVILFNIIYVIGHLINGMSAQLFDRIAVKKILGYPFALYDDACERPEVANHDNLRRRVLSASYLVLCVNLLPWVLLELTIYAFDDRPFLTEALQSHKLVSAFAIAALVVVHLGVPKLKVREARISMSAFAARHTVLILGVIGVEIGFVLAFRTAVPLLVLPLLNAIWAICERWKLLRLKENERLPDHFLYARATFLNPIYWAANLTDYGETPDVDVIRAAKAGLGCLATHRDFFWMAWISVQNHAAGSYSTASHFLSMYGMSRNLSNATGLVAVYSTAMFWLRRPDGDRALVITWLVSLTVLTFLLFVRFLYLYSCYFSRYVVRTAALMAVWQNRMEPNASVGSQSAT